MSTKHYLPRIIITLWPISRIPSVILEKNSLLFTLFSSTAELMRFIFSNSLTQSSHPGSFFSISFRVNTFFNAATSMFHQTVPPSCLLFSLVKMGYSLLPSFLFLTFSLSWSSTGCNQLVLVDLASGLFVSEAPCKILLLQLASVTVFMLSQGYLHGSQWAWRK